MKVNIKHSSFTVPKNTLITPRIRFLVIWRKANTTKVFFPHNLLDLILFDF